MTLKVALNKICVFSIMRIMYFILYFLLMWSFNCCETREI